MKPAKLAFEAAGRLFSVVVLGFAILRGGSSPLLFLWGLWIEEVLSLLGLSLRQCIVRRGGGSTGQATSPLGLYFAFPAIHLAFVLFFSMAGVTGIFSPQGTPLIKAPPPATVLELAAALAFWTLVDLTRAILHRRAHGSVEGELARIDREARLALFLPHATLIAGGFCLIMLRLGAWLSWGILTGKILFEVLSFAMSRSAPRDGA